MTFAEIFLLSCALSVDSMAVSVCGSLNIKKIDAGKLTQVALVFGFMQALLFFVGWVFGASIVSFVDKLASIVGFVLLLYLGISMIAAAFSSKANEAANLNGFRNLFLAAVATSVDAAGAGVSVAMTDISIGKIVIAVSTVFVVTFVASAIGTYLGKSPGNKFGRNIRIIGGIALLFIAVKLLVS